MNGAGFVLLRNRRTGKHIRIPADQVAHLARIRGTHGYEPAIREKGRGVPQPVMPDDPTSYDPFPDGEGQVPPAGWEQAADAGFPPPQTPQSQGVRWGDQRDLAFPANLAGPAVVKDTLSILNLELQIPAVVMLRLSAVETTGALVAPSANDVATFTVEFGCGAALQRKLFQLQVEPANGSANTDVTLTIPASFVRVSASVRVVTNAADHNIDVVARVAPFTSYPELMR